MSQGGFALAAKLCGLPTVPLICVQSSRSISARWPRASFTPGHGLASRNGFTVNRVTVRNQRTRWGSCSRRGTISLNWRLIQTPDYVRDYIALHELAHLRHMNHSRRFWQEVERLCPDYRSAERWLKQNRGILHQVCG